jgi:integrase
MASMPKPRLPHLRREKSRHGKIKWFYRKGNGPRIRLPDDYGSDEFKAAYYAADKAAPCTSTQRTRHSQNTLGWLFDMYEQSAKFRSLAEGTRRYRSNLIKSIVEKGGKYPLSDITEKSVRQGRERRAEKPEAANNWLKTMKAAFSWGVDSGLIDVDPTRMVKKIQTNTDGFHTWTVEEIQIYEGIHPIGTMPRLALDLMMYTGLRRQDACILGRQHIKQGEIHFQTGKTGQWVYLPVVASLQKSIDATQSGELTFLLTERGSAFSSPASFGNWFRKQCIMANVPGRAHGLRKAGAVLAAERGATPHQMMAIFGWTSEDMATHYAKAASRKKMGLESGGLLDRN